MYDPNDKAWAATDYPVTLAIWHSAFTLNDTPVSGDATSRSTQEGTK